MTGIDESDESGESSKWLRRRPEKLVVLAFNKHPLPL
jgi:hypothetical protein